MEAKNINKQKQEYGEEYHVTLRPLHRPHPLSRGGGRWLPILLWYELKQAWRCNMEPHIAAVA